MGLSSAPTSAAFGCPPPCGGAALFPQAAPAAMRCLLLIHLTCLGNFSPNTARDDFTFHSRYLSFKENVINAN